MASFPLKRMVGEDPNMDQDRMEIMLWYYSVESEDRALKPLIHLFIYLIGVSLRPQEYLTFTTEASIFVGGNWAVSGEGRPDAK